MMSLSFSALFHPLILTQNNLRKCLYPFPSKEASKYLDLHGFQALKPWLPSKEAIFRSLLHGYFTEFPEKPMQGAAENPPLTGRPPQKLQIPSKEQTNLYPLLDNAQLISLRSAPGMPRWQRAPHKALLTAIRRAYTVSRHRAPCCIT